MTLPSIKRLGEGFGDFIDLSKPVEFTFDGDRYSGFEGDVISSALAGSDQWLISRSFKYHRPRGLFSLAGHEANSIIQIGDEPIVYADLRKIEPGMTAQPVNCFGSLQRDWLAFLDRMGKFLPVGFYYRSFFRPKGAWRFWEPVIRRMAGLGTINPHAKHRYYDKKYGFFDVIIVGGGQAGMNAAIEAAKQNKSVLIVEESAQLGGALNFQRLDARGVLAKEIRDGLVQEIANLNNIEVMISAVATGLFTDGWVSVTTEKRLHKIRGDTVVIAAGSVEQPAVFRNNDRPGVMLGTAAQRLMRLYGVRPGKRGVVLTANDDGYGVALDCLDAGVEIAAILDLRTHPANGELRAQAQNTELRILEGSAICEATGHHHVKAINVAKVKEDGSWNETGETISCDFVTMSVGYAPNAALISHGGGSFEYDSDRAMHLPSTLPDWCHAAGAVNGLFSPKACTADGIRTGSMAAKGESSKAERAEDPLAHSINHPFPIFRNVKGKDFVDFDEDLQSKDILDGLNDGFRDIQLLKRYSTLGMGPSQGRHSNVNAIRLVAKYEQTNEDSVGTTTFRPPYRSEKIAVLAGRSFDPVRRTAMHHRHLEAGAHMTLAGAWLRPGYYRNGKSAEQSIFDEVRNCRSNVGMIDVSTLGGLDVRGSNAAEFVNRIYTWAYTKQQVGRARYLLMTDEAGVVIDDGVACRFADNHFYLTATTGGVDGVYREMLYWNAQWRLDVDITNVTAAFAGVNIAGPTARKVLEKLCDDIDLSAEGFPYMGVRIGHVAGVPARLLRVGFVGELGFEIHVPASRGEALWDAAMAAGEEFNIKPFGVEAQRVMRLEKGHIIIGQDTDGLTTPHEANMEWAVAKKKPFYVGKRSVDMQAAKPSRRRLLGFKLTDKNAPAPEECHLIIRDGNITGRVTSAVRSPSLDEVVGLAYIEDENTEVGSKFHIRIAGGQLVEAVVAPIPFYDPDNKRQEL